LLSVATDNETVLYLFQLLEALDKFGIELGDNSLESDRDEVSISPRFYGQLLRAKDPKVQKDTADLTAFLCIWGLRARVKALHKTLTKFTPGPHLLGIH